MARCITAKELVDAKESIIQEVIASIGSTSSSAAKDSPSWYLGSFWNRKFYISCSRARSTYSEVGVIKS